jgi:lysozyme
MPQLSARGAQFIGRFEGFRAAPYNDAVGNATIGFGHLIRYGHVTAHDIAEWGTLTEAEGIDLLERDAAAALAAVGQHITRPLAQHELDALTSFAFNCGGAALAGSVGTAVSAHQDPTGALEQWDHAGHTVLEGLLTRRKAEARLFTTGDYGDGEPPNTNGAAGVHHSGGSPPVPSPVPPWAWKWVEWKLGRAAFKGHAGDPDLRHRTGAPERVPLWAWTFLKRFG